MEIISVMKEKLPKSLTQKWRRHIIIKTYSLKVTLLKIQNSSRTIFLRNTNNTFEKDNNNVLKKLIKFNHFWFSFHKT